jgi:hypothetical protein
VLLGTLFQTSPAASTIALSQNKAVTPSSRKAGIGSARSDPARPEGKSVLLDTLFRQRTLPSIQQRIQRRTYTGQRHLAVLSFQT